MEELTESELEFLEKNKYLQYCKYKNCLEAGIDEAGRGPLFGRIYAGCVVFDTEFVKNNIDIFIEHVKDSKKFSNKEKRIQSYEFILNNCISYGIGYVEPWDIDTKGISKAVFASMHNALHDANLPFDHIIVDGPLFRVFTDKNDNIPDICIIEVIL